MAAFLAAEPSSFLYNDYRGLPTNLKCEGQVSDIAKEQNITVNGSLRYNPWLRECHFKYFDSTEKAVKTLSWYPIFR